MKVVHTRDVAWRRIGDDFVVLDLAHKLILDFNSSAGLIWSLLTEPRDIHSLTSSVDESLETEITRFVEDLIERGLLVETNDHAVPCEWPLLAGKPAITWHEPMQQGPKGTCAFLPSQNPICDQVPFS